VKTILSIVALSEKFFLIVVALTFIIKLYQI